MGAGSKLAGPDPAGCARAAAAVAPTGAAASAALLAVPAVGVACVGMAEVGAGAFVATGLAALDRTSQLRRGRGRQTRRLWLQGDSMASRWGQVLQQATTRGTFRPKIPWKGCRPKCLARKHLAAAPLSGGAVRSARAQTQHIHEAPTRQASEK